MDLHDFDDVAMNYDYYLPSMGVIAENFIEFHLSFAEKYGGDGILDIACGTGALTIPLAKAGYDVTALDLSAPMITVSQAKLEKENLHAELIVSNMTDFKIDRKFSLAIIARGGFMHLLTSKEQRQTLMNIKEHLTDGGVLTFNHFQPYPIIQAENIRAALDDYVLRSEYINHEGRKERIYQSSTYDYIMQIMYGNWKFETLDDDGNIIDTRIRPIAVRNTYRQEMEYLLELCGYEILNCYNDYNYDEAKDMSIWVIKK